VWILDATSRQFTQTQLALRDVVGDAMGSLDRLVIGINKVDAIRPGAWNTKFNLPSSEQKLSIQEKISDTLDKIGKVCDIRENRIVPYSAEKWFRLPYLLSAMLDACQNERAWVLFEKADLADYLKKISPEVLQDLKNTGEVK
jgi:predicted GTPase